MNCDASKLAGPHSHNLLFGTRQKAALAGRRSNAVLARRKGNTKLAIRACFKARDLSSFAH